MKLSPRYDGPSLIEIDGPPGDQLAPVVRQRRRMESLLAGFGEDEWQAATRCDGWNVQDVISHIIGVNTFWAASIKAGLAGAPTRILVNFDPAATPPLMVGAMRDLTSKEVLDQFVSTNDGFLGAIDGLDADRWTMPAEAPPGHIPIRLLASHALWDAWIHERDIAIPLGIKTPIESDEVLSALRYAAALSPAFLLTVGTDCPGQFAVEVSDPDASFVIEIDESVHVRDRAARDDSPCLRGDAVSLVEALSIREPLPDSTPPEWRQLLAGLEAVFDTPVASG